MKFIISLLIALLITGCAKDSNRESPLPPQSLQSPTPNFVDEGRTDRRTAPNFQKFAMIREMGGTDNAALFGVLPESGVFEVGKVVGPGFIKTYQAGTLTPSTVEKLFASTSKPLGLAERQDLLSKYNGATVIYTEAYSGQLCDSAETQYEIVVTGKVDKADVEVTFQFVASPSPGGICTFHLLAIIVRNI